MHSLSQCIPFAMNYLLSKRDSVTYEMFAHKTSLPNKHTAIDM